MNYYKMLLEFLALLVAGAVVLLGLGEPPELVMHFCSYIAIGGGLMLFLMRLRCHQRERHVEELHRRFGLLVECWQAGTGWDVWSFDNLNSTERSIVGNQKTLDELHDLLNP